MLSGRLILAADVYYLDVQANAEIEVQINGQTYDVSLHRRTSPVPVIYSLTLGYQF